MKRLLIYTALMLINAVANFLLYIYSFNAQATPFLHEEQRVESAMLIFNTTLPAYFISSLFITLLFYLVAKK
ncbi:hypothetical protein [Vibrio nigripulchritudo]|uniref:hypothetical protein n=1 Tax=Vibrio nigripulchritudo TaxID=28173 RepID=UPI0003B1F108|nr:hypothetical protein [Vibrio nigripulchritudo]CCN73097.1 exported hypothetical protein [Vibrio nigripulchritudo SFn118]